MGFSNFYFHAIHANFSTSNADYWVRERRIKRLGEHYLMSKNINQANSKLNASNNKLKRAYSKSHSKNMKVIYMPHWLEFYSSAIHNDVTSNKRGIINRMVEVQLYM